MTARPNPTSGKDNEPAMKLGLVYLWIALLLAIPVGRLRDLFGPEALVCGNVVFVALFAAAVWKVGAVKTNLGWVRERPTFLPGVLLLTGPLALLLGASVTGEPTASRPGDYVLNTTAILVGSLIMIGGYVALSARLWEAGQRLLPAIGMAGLVAGAAVWLANLVFRYAVVASGAAGLQAEAEDRAWVANEYLRGLESTPSWMELLLVWTDMLQLAFVVLAYLAAAALGAALVGAGWLGRLGGSVFGGLNFALAFTVIAGIILAGYDSVAGARIAYVVSIPFMVFVLPYFLGAVLLGGKAAERTLHMDDLAAGTMGADVVREAK
jgi:hypothetical protein